MRQGGGLVAMPRLPYTGRVPQIESTLVLATDAATAFALAHQVGAARADWDPAVAASRWIRGAEGVAPGAAVFIRSPRGSRRILRFELVEPGIISSARMIKGPWYLASYGEGLRFRQLPDGTTAVTWKLALHLRLPVAAKAAGRLVRPALELQLRARLAGLQAAAAAVASSGPARPGQAAAER